MSDQEQVREFVSKSYAKAVSTPSEESCCGPAPKHIVSKLAGYTPEELASLPPEAVAKSFGCGNPLAFSQVKRGDVVLDLGSGAGIDILLAGKTVGPTGRVIGVDMTEEMLAKARENIAASGLANVEVRRGIIEELPVDSESVDWVISNCVINLSPEKPRVFAEIARVLKPDGGMFVSDIVARELPESVRQSEALYSSCLAGAISEDQYVDGLRQAGLVDVEVRERLVYDEAQLGELVAKGYPFDSTWLNILGVHDSLVGVGGNVRGLLDQSSAHPPSLLASALRALKARWPTQGKQVLAASLLRRESFLEIQERAGVIPHVPRHYILGLVESNG